MTSALRLSKACLRRELLARRAALDPALALRDARTAQGFLLDSPLWRRAAQVALYAPVRGEMDTTLLLEDAWARGCQVLLPRCRPTPGRMDFVPCSGFRQLAPGRYNVPEPLPCLPALPWDDGRLAPDILVTPGVAFDRRGFRLGYGGGYYDRALSHPALAAVAAVGLAFALQILDALPAEPFDRRVRALCTEEGLLWL